MRFYTSFHLHKGRILLREVINGTHVNLNIKCQPYLFVPSRDGEYETYDGRPATRIDFKNTSAAREFIEVRSGLTEIHGYTSYAYPFINDRYPGTLTHDFRLLNIAYLDIETSISAGKPNVEEAPNEILSIAIKIKDTTTVFGCVDYDPSESKVNYVRCESEADLLVRFLELWRKSNIDIVTGWFIDMFDIPYLVHRIGRVLSPDAALLLSPWKIIDKRIVTMMGRECSTYNIMGVSVIDYMRAYKKFTYKERESYRLDFVCSEEKVGKKLDYSEFGNLSDLYEKNPQKFIDYNIRDIVLVEKLNDKLHLLELICSMAYYFKTTYEDTFGTVRPWEVLVHNHLMEKNVVVPPKSQATKGSFEGGYVKEPQLGKKKWVVSFDFDSLYPHLIMALNISNDTIRGRISKDLTVEQMLHGGLDPIDKIGHSVAASGYMFSNEKIGFFPEIMNKIYSERRGYKDAKKKASNDEKTRLEVLQKALKYVLNGGYGAMANEWFLWFDMRMAESITLSGQLAIRYTANRINTYLNRVLKTSNVDYVVAIDTDSVYITLERLVDQCCDGLSTEEIVAFVDKVCAERIGPEIDRINHDWGDYVNAFDRNKLNMKRETIADVGIFTAKKKYVLRAWDVEGEKFPGGDIKATGLEMVKSSTPAVCRDKLREAVKIMMTGTEAELQKFVKDFRVEFNKMRFEDIAFPGGINALNDYPMNSTSFASGTPQAVRGALMYNLMVTDAKLENKYGLIENGDKIRTCHMDKRNPTGQNIFACLTVLPPELGMERFIDYNVQFDKAFLKPLEIILDVIGWSHTKRATLAAFFE